MCRTSGCRYHHARCVTGIVKFIHHERPQTLEHATQFNSQLYVFISWVLYHLTLIHSRLQKEGHQLHRRCASTTCSTIRENACRVRATMLCSSILELCGRISPTSIKGVLFISCSSSLLFLSFHTYPRLTSPTHAHDCRDLHPVILPCTILFHCPLPIDFGVCFDMCLKRIPPIPKILPKGLPLIAPKGVRGKNYHVCPNAFIKSNETCVGTGYGRSERRRNRFGCKSR